jgi:D-lactate dehydrogenase (cytochrome)
MQKTQATFASAAQLDSAVEALKSLLGSRASTALVQREHHSHGETYHPPAMPDAVCYPHTTEEVSEIMKISAKYKVPVIPFGGGTSLEGHVNALYGGISIDLREMNKVLRVSAEDLDVTVEAGVTRQQLNKALDNTGLTFYVDPGGESTLGGMAATRASGTTTVRYGTMRDNVLALTVVMADGTIIKTGTRARKSSAGYDLTRLFVGSEGTLGIITNLTLRVHPLPEAVSAAVCSFPSVDSAVKTVIETIQFGASVARIELLDDAQMDAINKYSKTDYPVAPTLFFEFHGSSDRHVAEQAEFVQSIAEEHGAKGFQWATRLEDRDKLWEARHAAYYAAIALRPGSKGMATDACVPISRLAECIRETQEDNRNAPFPVALVGHVGDGNFHCVYVFDPENEAEIAEGERLAGRIATRALAMGGTCTGEHGIGYGKMKYLEAEHGPALEVMRTIKRALDPDNRMNPGKMVKV